VKDYDGRDDLNTEGGGGIALNRHFIIATKYQRVNTSRTGNSS